MITQVQDVIIPEVFMGYVINRTTELSRLVQSGILQSDATFDAKANEAGRTVNMPFWDDLDGDDEVLPTNGALTPGKLSTGKDVAIKVLRGKAWSYNDLIKHFTAEDPAAAIADMVAAYKVRRQQAQLLALLTGIFAAPSMSANALDLHITGGGGQPTEDNVLNGVTFIDAQQKLGDHQDLLVAIMMHSMVYADLRKQNLIEFIPQSNAAPLKSFQGLEIIIDDGITKETIDGKVVYSSFLFGRGAIALGNGRMKDPVDGGHGTEETEFAREALRGDSQVIFRWKNIMHPRGIKFADVNVADESPSNAELADPDNWVRVYDPKLIRVVRVRHNILG